MYALHFRYIKKRVRRLCKSINRIVPDKTYIRLFVYSYSYCCLYLCVSYMDEARNQCYQMIQFVGDTNDSLFSIGISTPKHIYLSMCYFLYCLANLLLGIMSGKGNEAIYNFLHTFNSLVGWLLACLNWIDSFEKIGWFLRFGVGWISEKIQKQAQKIIQ